MAIAMRRSLKAARRRASLSGCLAKFELRMRTGVSAIFKLPIKILTVPTLYKYFGNRWAFCGTFRRIFTAHGQKLLFWP